MSGFARDEAEGVTRGARAFVVLPQLREDPGRSADAVRDVSFTVAPGETVAIVDRAAPASRPC